MRFSTRTDWHQRVSRVIGEIIRAIDEPLTLRKLADYAAASPYHFHRTFRELTGETVGDCIRRLRLERAAELIYGGEERITDIAMESGFETSESFSKAFRKAFGITPSRVRNLPFWSGLLYSRAGIHYRAKAESLWFSIKTEGENMDTKIVNLPERRVIGVENIGNPQGFPMAWEKLQSAAAENNLFSRAKNYMSLFPESGENGRQLAGIEVDELCELPSGMTEVKLSGGLYAVSVHFGTPEEIGPAWEKWLNVWLPGSGWNQDPERFNYEWYQNDGCSLPPELNLTFLCTPVVKG